MQTIRTLPLDVVDLSIDQQAAVIGGGVVGRAIGYLASKGKELAIKAYNYLKCAADTFIACAHAALTS